MLKLYKTVAREASHSKRKHGPRSPHLKVEASSSSATPTVEDPDVSSFREPLKNAAKEAGIKKRIDLHPLRHSYGSNKIRADWGLKKVSMLLGHTDIQITSEVYTDLLDGDLKVRDDFRFDNPHDLAARILAELIARSTQGGALGENLVQKVEQGLDLAIRLASSGKMPLDLQQDVPCRVTAF